MARFPEQARSTILVNSKPILEAVPQKLWRRNNQAAVFDFDVPIQSYLSLKELGLEFRQGDLIEFWYGIGSPGQRLFYGYVPSTLGDRDLSESKQILSLSCLDFIGQLQDRYVTLGDSTSSFLNLGGYELGAAVAKLTQDTIDSQYNTISFSIQGIQGTNPTQQFLTETNVSKNQFSMPTGTNTAKKFIDSITALGFDDSNYPDPPLLYEYQQRDQYLVWRKQLDPLTANPVLRLTIGKDAFLGGKIQRQPVYSDAIISTKTKGIQWTHSDKDTSRRWGGRRFYASGSTTSSFLDDAQAAAIRTVEIQKQELKTFQLILAREGWWLTPGDVMALDNAEAVGLKSQGYRVDETSTAFMPTPKTTISFNVRSKLLTDYL